MAIDDLLKLTTEFLMGWKKGKLADSLKRTARVAADSKIKIIELEEKVRQLQDENRSLKGEKKKPKIKPANTSDLNPAKKKKHVKKSKKDNLEIDHEEKLDVKKGDLPPDAKFIGSREVVIQEIVFKRKNTKFTIMRYYSESLGRVIEAPLSEGFQGSSFGPELRSFVLYQYYKCRVPHQKILQMLKDWNIEMSKGTLCSILNNLSEEFSVDLRSAREAGLKKSSQVHIDDTGAKFNGVNAFTFGVGNRYFTSVTTLFRKNRWSAAGALLGGNERFLINDEAVSFIAKKLKRPKVTGFFFTKVSNKSYSRKEFEEFFKDPVFEDVYKKQQDILRTACAISALRSNLLGPPIRFLISDDATNFLDLVNNHQLCWVHEIRRYKLSEIYQKVALKTLEKLLKEWRSFYKLMKRFKNNRTKELRDKVRSEFDRITSIKTLIRPIDEQLERTKKKKDKLLLFLKYPQLPLHNNLSENDLRERVLKRKISLQNRSIEGMRAWDLMLSLSSTCRKIDLSFWKYLRDRIHKKEEIFPLGRLINSL